MLKCTYFKFNVDCRNLENIISCIRIITKKWMKSWNFVFTISAVSLIVHYYSEAPPPPSPLPHFLFESAGGKQSISTQRHYKSSLKSSTSIFRDLQLQTKKLITLQNRLIINTNIRCVVDVKRTRLMPGVLTVRIICVWPVSGHIRRLK